MSPDRRDELLVDEALGSLSPVDAVELRALVTDGHDTTIALTAALGARALSAGPEELPASVRDRLLAAADRFEVNRSTGSIPALPRPASKSQAPVSGMVTTTAGAQVIVVPMHDAPIQFDFARWAGWFVAAAAVAALLAIVIPKHASPSAAAPAAAARPVPSLPPVTVRPLLEDAVTVPVAVDAVRGSFMWSRGGQVGRLDVKGLPVIDETREAFQAWLADGARPGEWVPAGVVGLAKGALSVDVVPVVRVTDARELRLTRESAAGSLRPVGPVVLAVALP